MRIGIKEQKYLLSGRHRFFSSRFIFLVLTVFLVIVLSVSIFFLRRSQAFLPSVSSLYKDWNVHNYTAVYEKSGLILTKHPLNGSALALHGFSAYYLYVAQTDPAVAKNYLNVSITSLRNAWYRVSKSEKAHIAYVLGKAYYQRGYYYADLAIKYLDYASKNGMKYNDLPEFRGLSASLIGDYDNAIPAFIEALAVNPSDLLLFTLAENYLQAKNNDKAKQYFYETIRTSSDELLQLKCRYELGLVFVSEQKMSEAQNEFDTILEKQPNSADAHYGLGVVYENQGDLVRARAEWRRAIRINPVHSGAREKLNL